MAVQRIELYGSDGRMRRDFDMWFLYAAFTRPAKSEALVKIGITKVPLDRLFEVHATSPFPVEEAIWVDVGGSSIVRKLESAVKRAFVDRNTRGEWFRFDLGNHDDKLRFHKTLRDLFMSHTSRRLTWRRSTLEQILAHVSSKPRRPAGKKRWGHGPPA